jgi:predicted flap endonuclease-1-like 5' DNA nuclease
MEHNKLIGAAGILLLVPPLQESEGFLGVDWWVWILIGVVLLLLLLIIGFVMQNEPGPPIPKRESKMYVTPASVGKAQAKAALEPKSDHEPEHDPDHEPEPEPEPEAKSEPDDLLKIEGVGPKVADLLNNAGILTFAALAETTVERLNELLETADFQYMNPESWPEQAALAAKGDWEAFEKLTADLKGGLHDN